jgi:glycerol-1-phosphate dehydrogenase [NAD(P)+]
MIHPDRQAISEMANRSIDCVCGHTHHVPIQSIITGGNALKGFGSMLSAFQGKKVYLVGDENTMALGRDAVRAFLDKAKCEVSEYVFPCETGKHLVTNERLIGGMLLRMAPQTELLIAIGSGTMNDTARVVSTRCNIPYIIVATAPSMDGYASSTSAVVMDGGKKSVMLTVPYGIVGDTDLIKTAPDHMLAAGAGDILGKYVAIRDWKLAQRETGEYYCPYIADLVLSTADGMASCLPRLFDRGEDMLHDMMDSLVMAGIAICMYGTSRPAAGAEHQIAHSWEVADIQAGTNTYLHGNYVGLGALVACRLYELAGQEFDLPGSDCAISSAQMEGYLSYLKGYSSLKTLGISREVFHEGILHAAQPEIRYTLASYLGQRGKIEAYAGRLTEEFF